MLSPFRRAVPRAGEVQGHQRGARPDLRRDVRLLKQQQQQPMCYLSEYICLLRLTSMHLWKKSFISHLFQRYHTLSQLLSETLNPFETLFCPVAVTIR